MAATRNDIKGWLERELEHEPSHMVVVCDTFENEDYPVYVTKDQQVREIIKKYDGKGMQKVMEVYSYQQNLENQLNERHTMHLD